jgi:anti-anti-sigma factor
MLKPRLETTEVDGVLVAEFWDCLRLDPGPVSRLRDLIESRLREGPSSSARPDLVIDLSGVDFAGSSVLGAFVGVRRACQARGGRVVFCRVDPNVREVFRATNLDTLFRFTDDRASALALLHEKTAADPTTDIATEPRTPPTPAAPSRGPLAGRRRSE